MSEATLSPAADEQAVTRPVLLRQAREAAGLHIAALAAALKVPVRKLEALEAGRYAELPDMTFARALASSACRQLKVDPGPVLAQLPASPTPSLGDSRAAINAPFKAAHDEPSFNPWGWLSRPAVLGAIALLLGALVIVFLPAADPAPEVVTAAVAPNAAVSVVQEAAAPPPVVAQEPAPPALPATAPAPDAAAPVVPTPDAMTAAAPAGVAPAPVPVAPAPTADTAGASGALLSIVATEESWAEVVNGTGTVVLQRLLQPGERVEFSAAPPYAVVLGRAESVRVSVRGRPLDTAPLVRNNVARFEVK